MARSRQAVVVGVLGAATILVAVVLAADTPPPVPAPSPASSEAGDPRTDDLAAVGRVLEEHGVDVVIEWIREKRMGRITLEVNGRLKPALGPPNRRFVTPASVLHDLRLSRVDVATFASEISGAAPVDRKTMVISQADVASGGRPGPPASGTAGSQSSPSSETFDETDLDARCKWSARSLMTQAGAHNGCTSVNVTDVRSEVVPKMNTQTVYTVTGTCVSSSDSRVHGFEAGARCYVKPIGGAIWAEGSSTPDTVSVGTGLVWFKLVD